MFQKNAEPQKSNDIFVKMENESNGVKIMKYSCPSSSAASSILPNENNNRLLSELSDIRQKHSNAIYELEKNKEMVVTLNNDKHQLFQTIETSNKAVDSLSTQNAALELSIVTAEEKLNVLQRENVSWKDKKKQFESSIESLRKEKLATIENGKQKEKENERLRKELKVLEARLKQNVSGTDQNKRYFSQTSAQTIENSYEVRELLAHRKKKTQREFLVRWKDTWEKESSLNCPKILKGYLNQNK